MIILMAVVVGFIGFPMLQQIPVFARDVLAVAGEPEADIATRNSLIFTFQGIGALIAAFSLAAFNPKGKGKLLVAGQLIFTISIMLLAFSKFLPFTLAIFIMIGFGMVSTLATMNTLIQLEVPNEIRGRVFSAYLWGLQGISPFGNLLIGWMASEWGVLVTTFIAGASILLLIGLIHLKTPEIRRIGT